MCENEGAASQLPTGGSVLKVLFTFTHDKHREVFSLDRSVHFSLRKIPLEFSGQNGK